MNNENKNLGILKDGNEVFVGDLIAYHSTDSIAYHSTDSIWKVLGHGVWHNRVRAELISANTDCMYGVGHITDGLMLQCFILVSRSVAAIADDTHRLTIEEWQNEVLKNCQNLGSSSYSVPAILENCQCQSLFMNGHNHSCHMYVAPAPTINVWGIPQPVDNSQLIETIKNTKESSEPWLYTLSVRNDVSHRGHAAAEGDFVPFRVDSTGALRVMTNET